VYAGQNYVKMRLPRSVAYGLPRLLASGTITISLLGGCTSIPSHTEAAIAPIEPRAGYASLNIGRPTGGNVSIFPLAIHVDGKLAASLSPGQYTSIEIEPGKHTIGVPNEAWNRAIAGTPHVSEFVTVSGKTYYALPTQWYEDAGTTVSLVGSVAVPHRTAVGHNSFAIQSAGPSPEFSQLTYVKSP
jgi:hypothetical protein